MTDSEDREHRAHILVKQADRLLRILGVDASSTVTRDAAQLPWQKRPTEFRFAADAYDHLAFAEKKIDRVAWERTKVDGRSGDDLMGLLWGLLEEIRFLDSN
jgi:hypothetical protein